MRATDLAWFGLRHPPFSKEIGDDDTLRLIRSSETAIKEPDRSAINQPSRQHETSPPPRHGPSESGLSFGIASFRISSFETRERNRCSGHFSRPTSTVGRVRFLDRLRCTSPRACRLLRKSEAGSAPLAATPGPASAASPLSATARIPRRHHRCCLDYTTVTESAYLVAMEAEDNLNNSCSILLPNHTHRLHKSRDRRKH